MIFHDSKKQSEQSVVYLRYLELVCRLAGTSTMLFTACEEEGLVQLVRSRAVDRYRVFSILRI